jgi:hypothetical protein
MRPIAKAVFVLMPASEPGLAYISRPKDKKLTLEKVNGLIGNKVTSKVLCEVDTTHDTCTVEVGSFEQLNVARRLVGSFEVNDTTHHGNRLTRIQPRPSSKTANGMCSIFEATLADEPPWRFGSTEYEDSEWCREHPLDRNRNSRFCVS